MTNNSKSVNVAPARAPRHEADDRPLAILLDLSGDNKASMEWAVTRLAQTNIKPINKADLKWVSKRDALARVRALEPDLFALFTADLQLQSGLGALMLFAVCAGAREVIIGDRNGRSISRSRLGVVLIHAPRFLLELLGGYGLIVPFSWLLAETLRVSLAFGGAVRASRITNNKTAAALTRSLTALYIRATLAIAAEGGMPTHVAGFAGGAAALGHRLKFLVSAAPGSAAVPAASRMSNNMRPGRPRSQERSQDDLTIGPSLLFSATRALFELWNNLVFTVKTLRMLSGDAVDSGEIDFIYQRYSRFNLTGVALSGVTGLPLALEYNGSEVWVGRQWDPIGQLRLLKHFEQLNLRAADLVFVVSDVERRNLIESGVPAAKIIVNPNGVDPDRFHPECGGGSVRRVLGIDRQTVVGFVGTFGPWHGAPVLAEAARLISKEAGCHFLFIGDGDERAQTEAIVEASGVSATFAGRISHDEVPAYLDACDILVAPHVPPTDGSEFFGSPTKLFEYMAMGKGLVASRLGQMAEVIIDGENGLLAEPGDATSLARAIEKLALDEMLRARLGTAARQSAIERYTWKHNAARVFDAMKSMKRQ